MPCMKRGRNNSRQVVVYAKSERSVSRCRRSELTWKAGKEKAPARGRGFVHRHRSEAEVDTDARAAIVAVSMPVSIPMPVVARAAIVPVSPPMVAVMTVSRLQNIARLRIACLQVLRATGLRTCICCLRSGQHHCASGECSEDSCTLHLSVLHLHKSNGTGRAWFRGKRAVCRTQSVRARNCRAREPHAFSVPHCTYLFRAHAHFFPFVRFPSTIPFQGAPL